MHVPFPRPGIRTRAYRSRELAERMAGKLICTACGDSQACSAEQVAEYMDRGWPKCHGSTMTLVPNEGRT